MAIVSVVICELMTSCQLPLGALPASGADMAHAVLVDLKCNHGTCSEAWKITEVAGARFV